MQPTGEVIKAGELGIRHRLRPKLADALPERRFIRTHFGVGYRFQAELSHRFHKTATTR